MLPRVLSSFFSFRPATPSPRLSCGLLALSNQSPALRVGGRAGLLSICGCGRLVGLLACHRPRAALSLSLVRFFSSVCRAISYSIPDEMMRITGSCGIRLAIHSACFPVVVSMMRAM